MLQRQQELADKASGNTEWDRREAGQRAYQTERDRLAAIAHERNARIMAGQRSAERAEATADKKQDKADAAEEKKNASMYEVESRFQNIKDRASDIRKMIEESGTYEMFGPHNDVLDGKLNDVAVDTAKVVDPTGVARPADIEIAKQSLPSVGARSLGGSNRTALDVLKAFEDDLENRRAVAYKVRGKKPPSVAKQAGNFSLEDSPGDQMVRFVDKKSGRTGQAPRSEFQPGWEEIK